jgi:hypothetical protein
LKIEETETPFGFFGFYPIFQDFRESWNSK